MVKLKLVNTIFSKLGSLSKNDGQIVVSSDSKSLYVDLEGERIEVTDWIDVDTEEKLLAILSPLVNKYYYTKDTNKIWRYIGGKWECLNTSVNDLTPTYTESSTLAKLSSGEKLSVSFGKISKAITDLISHIGDSVKHITSTERINWGNAYTHSQSTHARTDATKVEKSATNGNIKINGNETNVYTHPSGTNPHGTTKSDVGLGNVGNFKAVSTVANQGLTDAEKSNARANIGAGASSFSGSYNDLTNKPTIPSVGNGTITIKQAGTSKGTFTMNQSGNTTIELTDNNTTYGVATSSALGLVKSGTDITVDSSGNVSVNDDSHNHVISNVDGLQSALDGKSATGHTHDDRYYTESEINTKLSGKANSSHTHTKSQITDFPTSMPASDVYAWAKASNKPSYTWDEITNKPSSFTPANHTHNYAGSKSAGGSANSLSYFKNTSTTDVGIDDTSANAVGYVNGTSSILNQNDGAMYKQVYSGSWAHEIYGDYRTGQIAVRGKNNGTWQAWRKVLDSSNYKTYCTPANIGALSLDSNVIHSKMYYSETISTNVKINISCTATTIMYAGSGMRQLRGLLRISWGSNNSNDSGCSILRTVDYNNNWRWINCSKLSAPSGTVNYSSYATINGVSSTTISFSLTNLYTPYVFIEYDNSISNLTITASYK